MFLVKNSGHLLRSQRRDTGLRRLFSVSNSFRRLALLISIAPYLLCQHDGTAC